MNLNRLLQTFQIIAGISAVFAIVFTAGGCKEATSGPGSESLSDPSVQPTVISTLPLSHTSGPFNLYNRGDGAEKPHFVLTFNKLMYKGSFTLSSFKIRGFNRTVAARIEPLIYYERLGKPSSATSVYYDNVLSFFIIDSITYWTPMSYQIGQQYTITLDTTVEDINGNKLSGQYTFNYTPEPYFRVVGMRPMNGTQDNSIYTDPFVVFNSPVDATVFGKLGLSPAVAGFWIHASYDSSIVFFMRTQTDLPFGTTFALTVDASAKDAELHQIDREYTSTFSTIGFRPTFISPQNGSTDVDPVTSIRIEFSGQIDTGTIRSGFTLSPAAVGTINVHYGHDIFDFTPIDGFRQNTTYTIMLTSSLRAVNGTPATPKTSTFRTGPFEIYYTYPSNGSANIPRSYSIQVNTNARLNGATIGSAIFFTPALPGSISFSEGSTYFGYNASELMSANTLYTVTILPALATKAGDHLPAPYTFTFTTGN